MCNRTSRAGLHKSQANKDFTFERSGVGSGSLPTRPELETLDEALLGRPDDCLDGGADVEPVADRPHSTTQCPRTQVKTASRHVRRHARCQMGKQAYVLVVELCLDDSAFEHCLCHCVLPSLSGCPGVGPDPNLIYVNDFLEPPQR